MNEKSNIPEIRFDGFNDEWVLTTLGKVSGFPQYGMNVPAGPFDGKRIYLRITDIDEDTHKLKYDNLTSPNTDIEKLEKYKMSEGDIVFARTGASVGKSYLYDRMDGALYYAGFLIRFPITKKEMIPEFAFQNTLTDTYNKFVKINSQRSGQPGLNSNEYSQFEFYKATLPEQKQISIFLSHIDKKIVSKKNELNKLTQIKRAMLQKMFPKENEAAPDLRFKGFEGEWRQTTLGSIGEVQSNGVDKKINSDDIPIYLLNYMDVYNKLNVINSNISSLMRVTATSEQIATKDVKKGDIFFTPSSETKEDIGHSMVIKENIPKLVYSYHIVRFRPKNNFLDINFSNYFANSLLVRNQLIHAAQGAQRFTVSQTDFNNLKIKIPAMKEQILIGNYFDNLDKNIQAKQAELDKLKQFKQAMLDKMFV